MNKGAYELLMNGAFLPAMPLALNEDRSFDEFSQRRLIRYYMESGADGIAAGVHTTQFAIRDKSVNLFERVLAVVIDEIRKFEARSGSVKLAVAGACGGIEQAVSEAKTAKALGYDAVLLSPGGLGDLSEQELVERTRAVADVIDVIGFYLQPAVGGRVFTYDYWRDICRIDGVKAIKCAAFNRYLTIDVARAIAFANHEIALYTGNDDSILCDLLTTYAFDAPEGRKTVATRGGLLGHWAVWTKVAADIFRSAKALSKSDGIPREMTTLAAQITDCNSAFFDTRNNFKGCIAGVHEVLRRQGLLKGIWCLDPNETLSLGQSAEIDRVYAMYPHLNDDSFVSVFIKNDA